MPLRPTPPSPKLVRAQIDSARRQLESNVKELQQKVNGSQAELEKQLEYLKSQTTGKAAREAEVQVEQLKNEILVKGNELATATRKFQAFQAQSDRALADLARVDQLDSPD